MIIEFNATNFRSIGETVYLSFEASRSTELEEYYVHKPDGKTRVLKLAALFGPNASGKTNVLLALEQLRNLVLQSANDRLETLPYQPNLTKPEWAEKTTDFELSFVASGTRFLYQVSYNKHCVTHEALYIFKPNKALVYERSTDAPAQKAIVHFKTKSEMLLANRRNLESQTVWNRTVLASYLKANIEAPVLRTVTDWFAQVLMPMVKPGTNLGQYIARALNENRINQQRLLYHMQQADFDVVSLRMESDDWTANELNRTRLFFLHENYTTKAQFELAFEDESRGTQQFFGMAGFLELLLDSPKTLFWDELETALHPQLLKHFVVALLKNEHTSQLFFTTHARDILDDIDIWRYDAVWFTDPHIKAETSLYSADHFDSSVFRQKNNIYRAYKFGRLRALPVLLDSYIHPDYGKE